MKRKITTEFECTLAKQQLEKLERMERLQGRLSIGSYTIKTDLNDAINAYEQQKARK